MSLWEIGPHLTIGMGDWSPLPLCWWEIEPSSYTMWRLCPTYWHFGIMCGVGVPHIIDFGTWRLFSCVCMEIVSHTPLWSRRLIPTYNPWWRLFPTWIFWPCMWIMRTTWRGICKCVLWHAYILLDTWVYTCVYLLVDSGDWSHYDNLCMEIDPIIDPCGL